MSFDQAWADVKTCIEAAAPDVRESPTPEIDLAKAGKHVFDNSYALHMVGGPLPLREMGVTVRAWRAQLLLQIGSLIEKQDRNEGYKKLGQLVQSVTTDLVVLQTTDLKGVISSGVAPRVAPIEDDKLIAEWTFDIIYIP